MSIKVVEGGPFLVAREVNGEWEMFDRGFESQAAAEAFIKSQPKGIYSFANTAELKPISTTVASSTLQ